MTSTLSTARPYAKAAFATAKSVNELQLWSVVLQKLALAVSDFQLQALLKNPFILKSQLSDLLIGFLHKVNGNGSNKHLLFIENFIRLLAENKRLDLLPDISALFEEDLSKETGYLSLTITSAFPLDSDQKKKTQTKLTQQFNSELVIDYKIDPSLIGGLLVRSGSWVLDGTIKSKLNRLRVALRKEG